MHRRRRPVSIHARTRRATVVASRTAVRNLFQSTPARGGRPVEPELFQSTPARGGRLQSRHGLLQFQSTPARGGRPRRHRPTAHDLRCFNPRPHAAGDRQSASGVASRWHVSIHARTRRATLARHGRSELIAVSIHARTRRATPHAAREYGLTSSFNPRPHAAGDTRSAVASADASRVSIHARTRRAT